MPLFLIVLGASAVGASIALFILRQYPDYVPAEKPSRRGRQRDMDALKYRRRKQSLLIY